MAISAVERRRLAWAAVAAVVFGCANPPAQVSTPGPGPATGEPAVQIGLIVGAGSVALGGDATLTVTQPDGARVLDIPAGEVWRATPVTGGIALANGAGVGTGTVAEARIVPADSTAPVRVNGRLYRGTLALLRDRTGLTVVNQVGMEAYLLGVISGEMGRRDPGEQEALRAQAVVSRTYALRNLGRWRADGFDLQPTVADQVYGGIGAETPEARDAVQATAGQILTWGGQPIDAFFFSTCGGRTADGTEVFRGADRPYLRSVPDVDGDGVAYCSISPRFRWREEWSGDLLLSVLRRSLPAALAVPAGRVNLVREVRIASRTRSGRVGQLTIALGDGDVQVDGPLVRQVLRTGAGEILRSNAFELSASRSGRRITRLVAEGTGNGHGVGFCQWGAVGRAHAGQDYRRILAAYYPETDLQRLY
ncbi:MAG TPA: SpoIID/LytB domain-containing protein [Gemmatimonadales bacterium]|nr:SpoIID/LytB domain-containing protein [Gemmatimonadales bacterium]